MKRLSRAMRSARLPVQAPDGCLVVFLLLFRTLNALLLPTLFEPDEVFQNLEPIPFALGRRASLSWDWLLGIRSINFVFLFLVPSVVPYRAGSMAMAYAVPKVVAGVFAALADFFAVKTAQLYAVDALPVTLLSHGLWLYLPRTHVNSFEAFAGIAAFYFAERCLRDARRGAKPLAQLRAFAYITLYGTFLRPSMALLPAVPFFRFVAEQRPLLLLLRIAPELLLLLGGLVACDSLFYGEPILVPLNFFRVNVLCGVSRLFGTQPWFSHFFFAAVLLGLTLPIFLLRAHRFRTLSASVALFVAFYSLLSHKEMRFLVPIVPFCNIVAARDARRLLPLYAAAMCVAVFIGACHQNIGSTILALQNEIRVLDRENGFAREIRVFMGAGPYIVPSYPFLANPRVSVRDMGANPNVFAKIPQPRIYRRFAGTELRVNEQGDFDNDTDAWLRSVADYDFIVLFRSCYDRAAAAVDAHFSERRRLRYALPTLGLERVFPELLDIVVAYDFVCVFRNKRAGGAGDDFLREGPHGARETPGG